ncbi:MAG TPA: MarR family winged helix-turn-helix transcriptional regulator [Spirochaetota bacterium]|nr:MarR family winged helix-turn-helix transcriptional regulator [Spirochaetota bacterium]
MKQTDKNILTALEKICQINRILLWELAKEESISPIQIQFMDYLHNKSKEFRTVTNLSIEFDLKKSTVSDSINNLIKKNFLDKEQDANDKRYFYLNLTQKAQKKIEKINKWNLTIYDKIKLIPEDEKRSASNFFVNLIKQLHEEKIIKTVKMCFYCSNFEKNNCDEQNKKPYYCSLTKRYFSDEEVNFNCDKFANES